MKRESLGKATHAYTMCQSPLEVGGTKTACKIRTLVVWNDSHFAYSFRASKHTNFFSVNKTLCFLTAILHQIVLFGNMTTYSFFSWDFWLHKNLYLSQVRTRLQKRKIGNNKICKFFANPSSIFLSIVQTGP